MAENQAKSTPARVLFLFTFLMAGLTAVLWRERQVGSHVETVDYPTALGDAQFCPVALLSAGQTFTATLDQADQPATFTTQGKSAITKRDDRLWKVGLATEGNFYLYQSDQADDTGWYVKSAEGQFYRVQRTGG